MLKIFIGFVETEDRELKGGYQYKPKYNPRSAHNTTRKTGREENIHTRHTLIETGKETLKEWA